MRLSNRIGRVVAGGLAVSGLLAAAPALADLAVTFAPKTSAGLAKTYKVTITNNGADTAHAVTLNLTLPAAGALKAATTLGCKVGTATGNVYPCEVGDPNDTSSVLGDIAAGAKKTITLGVSFTAPDTLPTTCDASVSLAVTSTNATANAVAPVLAWTDLGISVTGPATAAVGGNVAFTVTVVNNGPCAASNVLATDKLGQSNLTLEFQSSTGDCTDDPIADGCKWAALEVGGTKTFTSTYKVGPQPASLTQTGARLGLDVGSDQADLVSSSDDGKSDDSSAATPIVNVSSGGCSSVGVGAPLGLLAMAALFARRRRAR